MTDVTLQLSSRDRVERCLGGEEVDRPAWTLYRHFYEDEHSAAGLARNMLEWQRRWGFDIVKVQSRSSFLGEGWGARWEPAGDPPRPTRIRFPVEAIADWDSIRKLDASSGAFGEQLEAVRLIRRGLADDTPLLPTVFLPFSMAGRLLAESPEAMASHLRLDPVRIERALEAVTATQIDYVRSIGDVGADGVFFATTPFMASRDVFTEEEYAEFGRPYDLAVIEAANQLDLNVLHLCGTNVMLEQFRDYPVRAFSWESTDPRNSSIAEGIQLLDKAVIGGVTHRLAGYFRADEGLPHLRPTIGVRAAGERPTIATGSPEEVVAEARDAVRQSGGRRWILGAGCNIPAETPDANIEALQRALPSLV